MTIRTVSWLILFLPLFTLAQRKQKPTVLVYGTDVEAIAAAVQSARSSAPTLWVVDDDLIAPSFTAANFSVSSNHGLDGGIWMDVLMRIAQSKTPSDSVALQVKEDITTQTALNVLETIFSELPLLTIRKNTSVQKITLGRRGWNVTLSDRSKHEFRAVIDASTDQSLTKMASELTSIRKPQPILRSNELSLEAMRTTVAIGETGDIIYAFTRDNLLDGQNNNFFTLQPIHQLARHITDDIPLRMHFAQALGAAAAYTAFFKTSADKIDVRKLQTELMTYGSRLLPYTDIRRDDPHFTAYQKTYLTGIFRNEDNVFDKDRPVRFDEIAPILNQLYSRSQLWFLDNKDEYLTWKDLISLVKFLGMRGDEVDRQIEKDWVSKFGFDGNLEPERLVTRSEFAITLDRFANPYTVSVNNDGVIRR